MHPQSDQELSHLLSRAQAGDRPAYQQFLARTRELVTSTLRGRVRSGAELDDVVQETLISIHCYRHTYDPARPIGPWIHTIALNRLRDHVRARARETNARELDFDASGAAPADEAAALPLLHGALAALSTAQREVIWLLKFEGYSVLEIAERTGRSTASVKVTAHRGYRVLRALLGNR